MLPGLISAGLEGVTSPPITSTTLNICCSADFFSDLTVLLGLISDSGATLDLVSITGGFSVFFSGAEKRNEVKVNSDLNQIT